MKILIPVDGSPASTQALKLAIDQLPKASFVIVNVQNPATLNFGGGGGIMPLEWIEQQEERRPGKHCKGLLPFAARRELLTLLVRSEARLRKRSIAWHVRNTWRRFLWEPEGWAGFAVWSSVR